MKKFYPVLLMLIAGFAGSLSAQNRFWVAASASNWNNSANWSTTSGGAGGASIPGTGGSEVPVFNANGPGNCNLDISPLVPGITVNGYTGTINLVGNNLTTTGANTFTTGTISNSGGAAAVVLNTTGLTTFNGTLFTANISGSTGRVLFNGSAFNGTVSVNKTGNTNDDGTGNNTFGNSVTLQNSSANRLRMATTTPDTFNGTLNLVSNGTGALELAYSSAGNQFNNNIVLTYTTPATISFGLSTGTSTLASGRTLTIGGFGGSGCGNLYIGGFTQSGATPQTISLAGNTTAILSFVNSNFTAAVNLTSPRYGLNGSTFQGAVTLTKSDGGDDNLTGGNTFQGTTLVTNNGSGELNFGNTNPDIFNNNLTLNNTSTGRNQIGVNAAGNIINGNLTINHGGSSPNNTIIGRNSSATVAITGTVTLNNSNGDTGAGIIIANDADVTISGNIIVSSTDGRGVYFGNASGTVTQTSGGITTGTFTAGNLYFSRFTQTSTAANTLTLTGSNILTITNASTFGGNVNFRAPQLITNGTTYNGAATLEKTGGSDNSWAGNTFQGTTIITHSGSAEIYLGNGNADTFNGVTTFNNTGSYRIRIAYNHSGQTTTFAQPVTLNSNKSGGSDSWSFLIGEANDSHVTFQQSLTLNVAGTLRSDCRFLNGIGSIGTFNGPVTINETNTHASTLVSMGVNGTATYAENIVVNNSGGTSGVTFNTNAIASSTLANGKTITIGGGGFTAGNLNLYRFTQAGNTPQTLTSFSGTAALVVGPNSAFGGNVNFVSPRLYLNGCTYSGTGTFEKTGASDDIGTGGNTFQGTTSITNSGTGYLLTANVNPDIFNADLTVTNTGSNYIYLAHNVPGNEFNGNLILNNTGSALGIRFSQASASTSTFNAGTTKTISIGGSGFTTGELGLKRFSEIGTAAQTLLLTGTATLTVGPSSQFDGNVNFTAPRLFLNGCTYSGTGTFEKTGDLDDASTGGNIFTGTTIITNSGLRYLLLGNGARDQFLSATTFNNTGSFRIYFGHNHPGQITEFASDLTLNSNKSGGTDGWSYLVAEGNNTGISVAGNLTINCAGSLQSNHRFLAGSGATGSFNTATINVTNTHPSTSISMGENGTSTYAGNIAVSNSGGAAGITFNTNAAASSTLNGSISSGVFSSGSLNLYRFTQVGVFPQTLTLTVDGTILRAGPGSSFDGPVTFISPRLLLHGATYQAVTYLEKTGANDDPGAGGNTFNGTTTMVNSGSGYLMTANSAPDTFNGDVTITNTGSNFIYLAHNVTGNVFNGNITLNNTGTAPGIRFANNATGAATFNAGTNKTISIGGSGFSTGELGLRRFTQLGTAAQTITLTGVGTQLILGPTSEFNGNVSFTSPRLYLQGAVYNGTTSLTKNGASDDYSSGGNTFNGTSTITHSGSGYLLTAGTTPDIFNGDVTITNSGSNYIYLAYAVAGNQFNGNITLNNTGSALGIRFAHNTSGAATFNAGTNKTISVGGSGFSTGELGLRRFTQTGSSPQTLTLTGSTTQMVLGPVSEFNGNVTFTSPKVFLNGTRYNGTAYIEKTAATADDGTGGNTFNQLATIVNSGSSYLLTASTNPDVFNSTLILQNNGSSTIRLADNSAGNQFNGNIELNSTSGGGIYFGNNANGTSTLAATRTIAVGSSGFITGDVRLIRFTQVGPTPQALNLGGIAILTLGPSSSFGGNIDFRSPQLYMNGTTFSGTSYLEKKGAGDNYSNGGNTFVGSSAIVDSGAGYLAMALNLPDVFQSDLTVTNTGSNVIYLANNVTGNAFNGNITFNSTLGSGGIYIGNNGTASATLGTGASLLTGGLGFSSGELRLKRLTQIGSSNQTLTLTGTALLRIGPATTFNGNVDFRSPQIALDGALYNGVTYLEKTGANNNDSNGGNSFLGTTTTIANSGTGWFRFALGALDTFGAGDLILTNTGTATIRMADNVPGTVFNGNIFVNSTSGGGVYFSESGGGTATIVAGKSIAAGGTGFTTGELRIRRFTQTGTTAQNIVLTGAAALRSGPAVTWNGNFTASSPIVLLDGSTFNGTTNSITKTGTTPDVSVGGNVFSAGTTTTFINSNIGVFRLGNTTGDDFIGNVIFNQASGSIQPAYNVSSTFQGDVTVNGAAAITFGAGAGTATFTGTVNQNVIKTGTASPIFRRLTMNKPSGTLTLNTDATISTTATFTSGIVNTTATNYLNFADDATTTAANNLSFVDGPVRKTGNDAFTFPIGDATFYRPAAISAPSNAAHHFTAQYFKADHGLGSAGDPTFTSVSKCEYWTIDRTNGTSNVLVTLSWQEAACVPGYITQPSGLRVARWNGSSWVNHGNGGTTGTATNGTIVTSAAVTAFSPFTLASAVLANPLPVELTSFTATVTKAGTGLLQWHTESELNNDRFEIQRSENGIDFTTLGSIAGAGTTNRGHDYQFEDTNPILKLVYYRLKQIDFDGKFEYSGLVPLDFTGAEGGSDRLTVSPNPISSGSFATFRSGTKALRQTVTIYNNLNQEIRKYSDVEGFSTDGLSPGIYIVKNKAGEIFRLVIK